MSELCFVRRIESLVCSEVRHHSIGYMYLEAIGGSQIIRIFPQKFMGYSWIIRQLFSDLTKRQTMAAASSWPNLYIKSAVLAGFLAGTEDVLFKMSTDGRILQCSLCPFGQLAVGIVIIGAALVPSVCSPRRLLELVIEILCLNSFRAFMQ